MNILPLEIEILKQWDRSRLEVKMSWVPFLTFNLLSYLLKKKRAKGGDLVVRSNSQVPVLL